MKSLYSIAKAKRYNQHQILEDIIYRWSPRNMSGEPLKEEELLPLFEAARWAPSSSNNQEWKFFYAHEDTPGFKNLFNLLNPGNQKWCKKAGVLIILVSQKISEYKNRPIRTHAFDTGSAWMAFAIEGLRRNYIVHAMAGFDYDQAEAYLDLDQNKYSVQCMIALGKPGNNMGKEEIRGRKKLEEIITKL